VLVKAVVGRTPKVIVCALEVTLKLCVTGVAAE
jgi:hypothetical protein